MRSPFSLMQQPTIDAPIAILRFGAVAVWKVGEESVVLKGAEVTIEDGTSKTSNSVFLDEDEVSGLVKAIDQMKQIIASIKAPSTSSAAPKAMEETAVTFKTREDFAVTIFGNANGFVTRCAINGIPRVRIEFSSSRLDDFGALARASSAARSTGSKSTWRRMIMTT
jgi:hypothetical protein